MKCSFFFCCRTKSSVPDNFPSSRLEGGLLPNHTGSAFNARQHTPDSGYGSALFRSNQSSQEIASVDSPEFVGNLRRPTQLHSSCAFSPVTSLTQHSSQYPFCVMKIENALKESLQQSNPWSPAVMSSSFSSEPVTVTAPSYSKSLPMCAQLPDTLKTRFMYQPPLATPRVAPTLFSTKSQFSQARTSILKTSSPQPVILRAPYGTPINAQLSHHPRVSSSLTRTPGPPFFLNPYETQNIEKYGAFTQKNFTEYASAPYEKSIVPIQRPGTPFSGLRPSFSPAFSGFGYANSAVNLSMFNPSTTAMRIQQLHSFLYNPIQVSCQLRFTPFSELLMAYHPVY